MKVDRRFSRTTDGVSIVEDQEEAEVEENLRSVLAANSSTVPEPESPPSTPRSTIKSPILECPSTPLIKYEDLTS